MMVVPFDVLVTGVLYLRVPSTRQRCDYRLGVYDFGKLPMQIAQRSVVYFIGVAQAPIRTWAFEGGRRVCYDIRIKAQVARHAGRG
jgi:hypothetical protein